MDYDPYDLLGVHRGASAATIKRAYRKKAKETHPDAGGAPGDFERVNKASLILLDPERRKKYDETGKIDEKGPDNAVANAIDKIILAISRVTVDFIQGRGHDPTHMNLLAHVRSHFHTEMAQAQAEQRKAELAARTYRKIREYVTVSKPGANQLLLRALESSGEHADREAERIGREIQKMQDCVILLEAFAWTGPSGPANPHGLGPAFMQQQHYAHR